MYVLYCSTCGERTPAIVGFARTPDHAHGMLRRHLHDLFVTRAGTQRADAMFEEPDGEGLFLRATASTVIQTSQPLEDLPHYTLYKRVLQTVTAPGGWFSQGQTTVEYQAVAVTEYFAVPFDTRALIAGSLVPQAPADAPDAPRWVPPPPCLSRLPPRTVPYMDELRALLETRQQQQATPVDAAPTSDSAPPAAATE